MNDIIIISKNLRLTKKGVIPHFPMGIPSGDAGSPSVDLGRRYHAVAWYDGMDNITAIPRPFWTAYFNQARPFLLN